MQTTSPTCPSCGDPKELQHSRYCSRCALFELDRPKLKDNFAAPGWRKPHRALLLNRIRRMQNGTNQ